MKIKRMLLVIVMISIILMCIPTEIFGWLQHSTYESCNIINKSMAWIMKIIGFILAISYITGAVQYIKRSKQEKKEKINNVLTWLVITTVQVLFLFSGAIWVEEIGMETYWSNGERYQFKETDVYISNGIRITAFISMIAYIITSFMYFIKSKQENIRKIENIIKYQLITSAIVAALLTFARNW